MAIGADLGAALTALAALVSAVTRLCMALCSRNQH
jgi:hypothetical protein